MVQNEVQEKLRNTMFESRENDSVPSARSAAYESVRLITINDIDLSISST